MSYNNLGVNLSALVVLPNREDVLKTDLMLHDAGAALKEKGVDQFKMHLLMTLQAEDVGQYFDTYAADFKKLSGEKAMPTHFRTNKCVLLACEKLGIPVLDAAGLPRGKSELDKAIAEAKNPKTPLEKALDALGRMAKASDECTQAELDVLINAVSENFPQLVVVSRTAAAA